MRRRRRYTPQPPCGPGPSRDFITRWQRDLAIWDQLGPLARAAVENSPKAVELPAILAWWRQEQTNERMRCALEFQAMPPSLSGQPLDRPDVDAALAAYIGRQIRSTFGKPPEAYRVERRPRPRIVPPGK